MNFHRIIKQWYYFLSWGIDIYEITLISFVSIWLTSFLNALSSRDIIRRISTIGCCGVYWHLCVHNFNRSTSCKNIDSSSHLFCLRKTISCWQTFKFNKRRRKIRRESCILNLKLIFFSLPAKLFFVEASIFQLSPCLDFWLILRLGIHLLCFH